MNLLVPTEPLPSSGVDAQNPWPGLVTFTEELRGFFHGRDDEADELLRRVQRKNLTVLFGQSGLGKSSLLQAGLFPRLRAEGYLPVPIRLDHAASAPPLSEQVKAAVARAIVDTGGLSEAAAPDGGATLWEHFHRRGLRQQTRDGRPVRLVLVFDQFEELFAIGHASEETRARAALFLAEMADLIENRAPQMLERRLEDNPELVKQFVFDDQDFQVLVCFREDYLPHLESLRPSMPSLAENRMRLTRMNGTRALEAVTGPGGDLIAPEVGRQIVRFVAGARAGELNGRGQDDGLAQLDVEPSLLSLVCRELNNRRLALGLPHITADLLAGNREHILRDYYERCVADQPPEVRAFIEDELVTDSGLRENMALERARRTLTQRGAPASAIDELVKRRLLHLEERLDIQRVELTHDVLTPVVKKSRDQRQQKEATLRAEQHAREVREKARRQRRRLRLIVGAMAAALLVVGAFGVASFIQYRISYERLLEARQARAEALQEKERAEENQKLADRSFDEARGTVDEVLTEMSEEGLRDVPGLQKLRQRFAQKAADRYEVYRERRPDDLGVTDGHARSLTALGTIIGQVGSVAKAVATLEEAIRIREGLVAREPANLEYQFQLARARLELGNLYWSFAQNQKAQPHVKRAIAELDAVIGQAKTNIVYRLRLVKAYNLLGNVTRDGNTNTLSRGYYERARIIGEELCAKHPDNPECLMYLAPPIANLAMLTKYDGDYTKALELEDKFLELTEEILKRFPRSPNELRNRGIGFEEKADLLMKLKRPDEATKCIQEALASYRGAAKENPLVSRYQWSLANGLRILASHLSNLGHYVEAKALYEESCEILDALTQGGDALPMHGIALIKSWTRLATFYQGGEGDKADEVTRKQGRLRCLEQAVRHGQKLSKKFPNDPDLHFQIADALYWRAVYESDDDRNKEAYPFFEQCVETFRTRVCGGDYQPTDYELGEFIRWTDSAQQCAQKLKRGDDVIRLAEVAYNLGRGCTTPDGIKSLGTLISRSAEVHMEAGRHKEAVETYTRAVKICKAAFEKAPWHWYLRNTLSIDYKGLAKAYEKLGDFPNEVLAWREYLKVWAGPMQGMKIEAYLVSTRPTNEAEAIRLREFLKSDPGMKSFNISYVMNGLKYPLTVYVTNVPWPEDPLEDQAHWLKERNGGTIPEETRASYRNLHKIAYENHSSFVELCGNLYRVSDSKKEELEKTKKWIVAKVVALTEKLKKDSNDAATHEALAEAYQRLAKNHKDLDEIKEAIRVFEQSRLLLESATRQPFATVKLHESLGNVYFELGELYCYTRVKEYEKSHAMYQRHHEVFERLSLGKNAEPKWRAEILHGYRALGYLCGKAFVPADGAVWYLKAMEQDNSEAAKGLASLYLDHPEIAAVIPEPTRKVLMQVAEKTKKDPRTFPYSFSLAIKRQADQERKDRIAQLQESAEQFRLSGERYLSQKKPELALVAFSKERDLRIQKIDQLRADQARSIYNVARATLELGRTAQALPLLEQAKGMDSEEATFALAALYEQGHGVPKDMKKAVSLRSNFTFGKGRRLYDQGKYAEALVEFQRSEKESPSVGRYQRIGRCLQKLGRNEEAIAAFKEGVVLATGFNNTHWVVLELLETALSANKPEEVFAALALLEKRKWSPDQTTVPHTVERELAGMRAIALHMADKDASEAEKKLQEIASRPNLSSQNFRNIKLDEWRKAAKPSEARQADVQKILDTMAAPARELDSPYYPLKLGSSWVYKTAGGERVIIRVARRETVGERAYYLLETVRAGRVTGSERIVIDPDGVYRQSSLPPLLQPHVCILPLPPRGGDSWTIKSRTAVGAGVTGQGATRVQDVTVPAGQFTGTIVAEVKTQDASGESVKTVWYAKGVGPVKVLTKIKKGTLILELEKTWTAEDSGSRYLEHYRRGVSSFREGRYIDALPDLKKACELVEADAEAHDKLGQCYGKLGRWDEAIKAYTRSIELDPNSDRATGTILNLLEALIVAERPEQLLQFVQEVEKKGWKPPTEGTSATKYNALYHGFRAIALRMSGKDASAAERAMRQLTGKPDFKITGWTWDEIDQWLKTTKLAPDRKAAVQKIVAELRGTKSR